MNQAYKDFLQRVKSEPDKIHTPSPEADIEWHKHILNTKEYQTFCMEYFGTFLHHDPNTGTGYCAANLEK